MLTITVIIQTMKQEVSATLAAKQRSYESATQLVRWIGIVGVVASYPWQQGLNGALVLMVLVAISYNVMLRLSWFLGRSWLSSRPASLFIDTFFVYTLLLVTGGAASPYVGFMALMVISAAYWYGALAMSLLAAVDLVVLGLLLTLGSSLSVPAFDPLHLAAVQLMVIIMLGVYVFRLTSAERIERVEVAHFNAQILTERQRLVALINSMTDAVLAVDEQGAVTLYNGSLLSLVEAKGSIKGKQITSLLHLFDSNKQAYDYAAEISGTQNGYKRRDIIYLNANHERVDIELTVLPYHLTVSGHQARRSYILILRDITKEKSLEDQRDEFISITSHEMRTPLAIIEANISTAMLPLFGPIGPKATAMLNTAHQNVILLGQFLQDLSTLSKLEQGNLTLDLNTIDAQALVRQVVTDYIPQAKAKGLKLVMEPGQTTPFLSSESRIREILQNFVTNAIKYTLKGTIVVKAETAKGKEKGIIVSVADSGIGIGTSDKKHLFTKYYRADDPRTRQASGTGIGLYLTLGLAERLGGKIWYVSRLNKGSTFYLQVPPYVPETEGKPKKPVTKKLASVS